MVLTSQYARDKDAPVSRNWSPEDALRPHRPSRVLKAGYLNYFDPRGAAPCSSKCDTVKWWDVRKRNPTEMQGWMAIRNELLKKKCIFVRECSFCDKGACFKMFQASKL